MRYELIKSYHRVLFQTGKGLPGLDPYNYVVDLLFILLELKSLFSLIFLKALFVLNNLLSIPVEGLLSL